MAKVPTNESMSYNPEEWLKLSGKKLERYYYKSQTSYTFKLGSKKTKKTLKNSRSSKGSSDCPPMINSEEIKITIFEYPKSENYKPNPPTVKHFQWKGKWMPLMLTNNETGIETEQAKVNNAVISPSVYDVSLS